jgi:hypothetical protein
MRSAIQLLLLLSVMLLTNGCVVLLYQSVKQDRRIAAMHGKKYTYKVKPAPLFLSEELALTKAWQTLAREGFSTNEWRLVRTSHPVTAPDGTRDRYFGRMKFPGDNPARGTVQFRNGSVRRTFDVRLDGKRIICHSLFTGTSSKSQKLPTQDPTPPRADQGRNKSGTLQSLARMPEAKRIR